MNIALLLPIFFPILMGFFLLIMKKPKNRKVLPILTGSALIITAALVMYTVIFLKGQLLVLFHLSDSLPVYFRPDQIGRLFVSVVTIIWVLAGFFSFSYLKGEEGEKRFYGFYLMIYGVLVGLDYAGNLITFYIFYELMTLLSVPLVMHTRSREAIISGLKYLFYSLAGAYMVLFGIYFLSVHAKTIAFTLGGVLDIEKISGQVPLLLGIAFIMIIGFGVKAGMFPVHAWLTSAHPVAPAPASAVLSSIIVKSGVLGIIRVVYYIFGAEFLRGTWVQTVWLILILITIFMGSLLAFREPVLKKRLAYSTVSQISYILFGLALFQPKALEGSLLHFIFHAFVKCGLFLVAGAIIHKTGKTRVDQLYGIGKKMPVTMWCFTILSLALIGIPPTSGFISKWYLAQGALASGMGIVSWLGPIVLLISALLTAGYLLPIVLRGYFPGGEEQQRDEAHWLMLIPMGILSFLALLFGMFPNELVAYVSQITAGVL